MAGACTKLLELCTSLFPRRAKFLAQLKINFWDCSYSLPLKGLQSSSESKVLHSRDPMTNLFQALKTTEGDESKVKGRIRRIVILAKEEVSDERKRKRE